MPVKKEVKEKRKLSVTKAKEEQPPTSYSETASNLRIALWYIKKIGDSLKAKKVLQAAIAAVGITDNKATPLRLVK